MGSEGVKERRIYKLSVKFMFVRVGATGEGRDKLVILTVFVRW